uniref:Uncharacterized protein n=1 Tax=Anguilla anguilla TaxID=7936 RepID=A0A0E9VQV5_ANGAN
MPVMYGNVILPKKLFFREESQQKAI